jgi:hypothetical protein
MSSLEGNAAEYTLLGIILVLLAGFLAVENIERPIFAQCALIVTAAFFISVLPVLSAIVLPSEINIFFCSSCWAVGQCWLYVRLCADLSGC